jgi:NCS2 family nucleobase:cation symporter-2
MTGVVNRFSVATGAVFLMAAGLIPKFGAICAAMPSSVLGGAVLVVFSMITVSGIRMISKAGLDGRNGTILAISLGLGLGFASVPEAIAQMPGVLNHFFADSVVASGILALVLNMVYPQAETVAASEDKQAA